MANDALQLLGRTPKRCTGLSFKADGFSFGAHKLTEDRQVAETTGWL